MVPADSPRIPRVPGYSGAASPRLRISLTGLSPSAPRFPAGSAMLRPRLRLRSYNPGTRVAHAPGLGWCGFARRYFRNHWFVFSSSGYLDVSVSPGSPRALRGAGVASGGLPPFGNPAHQGYLPLRAAYRSLSRPSSPPRA